MYESFFDLQRRPFAVTPDPGCWHHEPPFQPTLDELVVCAEQGQGIGVLIAPAGTGKTLVCERLARELRDPFVIVLLRHATFTTRRALLQTILCETGRRFDRATDQELRLEIATLLKEWRSSGKSLVLIVDEAHQLPEAVLDELRILSDHAADGRPLVRLILAGQLSLEEKLALPGAQALGQRIRAHVVLPTLTREESADYIDYRITWAGGRTDELFTAEALDVICRAADGSPRCLNQLCDHTLLLAFVNEQRPATARTVRDALADLSHLPLPWNSVPTVDAEPESTPGAMEFTDFTIPEDEPLPAEEAAQLLDEDPSPSMAFDTDECVAEFERETVISPPVYHLSHQLDEEFADELPTVFADATPPQWNLGEPVAALESTDDAVSEELVVDRYTALDAGLQPPELLPPPITVPPLNVAETLTAWWSDPNSTRRLTERLAAVQHVLDAVAAADDELPDFDAPVASVPERSSIEDALLRSAQDLHGEARSGIEEPTTSGQPPQTNSNEPCPAVFEFGAELSPEVPRQQPGQRSCRNLFTMLRRKQQGRA